MTIYKLKTPFSEEEIRKLRVNDVLYTSGTAVTARDVYKKNKIFILIHL
jgi:tartrate dehydratase beta subunit/fumarate hydratase class I family protein